MCAVPSRCSTKHRLRFSPIIIVKIAVCILFVGSFLLLSVFCVAFLSRPSPFVEVSRISSRGVCVENWTSLAHTYFILNRENENYFNENQIMILTTCCPS